MHIWTLDDTDLEEKKKKKKKKKKIQQLRYYDYSNNQDES